jgi:two-component system OmpR family response regulator
MTNDSGDVGATLLLVDDDESIRRLLGDSLRRRGYRVLVAGNAQEMDRILARSSVDVLILDVVMPGEDGFSVVRRIAANGDPPLIILSALDEEQDRILGLELGAEHYLTKPCSAREVLAHVRVVLRSRRSQQTFGRRYSFGGWQIDLDARELKDQKGEIIHLTDGEFAMLRVFVTRPRRVLRRDELIRSARGVRSEAAARAVDIQVSRLRQKLLAPGDTLIRTVRNEGYMLVAKVTVQPSRH